MNMLVQFVPWIVFAVVSNIDWRLGLAAGLVAQLVLLLARQPRRVHVLDGAMLAFFVVVGALSLISPDSFLKDHVHTLAVGWIALVAFGSIVVGHPFTLDFSRDTVSPEVARSTRFIALNRTITAVWGACFAGMALAGILATATDRPGLRTGATIILLLAAISFTVQHRNQARARALAAVPHVN